MLIKKFKVKKIVERVVQPNLCYPLAKVFTSRLSALLDEIISSRALHGPRLTMGSFTSPLCGLCLQCAAMSWHVYAIILSLLWDL
jgi:hypothetical protein